MRKLILGMSFILAMSVAQAQKMEVSASYGTISIYGISNGIVSAIGSVIYDEEAIDSKGVLNVAFNLYSPSMKWRYGVDVSYESFDTNQKTLTEESFTTISPKVDYFWNGADKKLRLYSGVSVGVLLRSSEYMLGETKESFNDTVFGFNVTPIGLRYGGKFAGFVESNIGTKGILQGGVAYQF